MYFWKAARIANTSYARKKGGQAPPDEEWTVQELQKKPKKLVWQAVLKSIKKNWLKHLGTIDSLTIGNRQRSQVGVYTAIVSWFYLTYLF